MYHAVDSAATQLVVCGSIYPGYISPQKILTADAPNSSYRHSRVYELSKVAGPSTYWLRSDLSDTVYWTTQYLRSLPMGDLVRSQLLGGEKVNAPACTFSGCEPTGLRSPRSSKLNTITGDTSTRLRVHRLLARAPRWTRDRMPSAHRNLRVHLTSKSGLLVQGRQSDQTANAGIAAGFARPARNRSSQWGFRASRPPHWLWGASPGEERVISCTRWLACVHSSGAAAVHLRGSARVYSITACQSVELGANSEMEPGRGSRACDPGYCQCQSHPPSARTAARRPGLYVPSEGLHAKI